VDKLSETEHVYKIKIIENIVYGDLALFECINHPKDEYGLGGGGICGFQTFLNPEHAILSQAEIAIKKYIADHGCNEEWDKDYIRGLFKAIDIVKGLQK